MFNNLKKKKKKMEWLGEHTKIEVCVCVLPSYYR